MPLTDENGNEINPEEWLLEAIARLAAEIECASDHLHRKEWAECILHLRSLVAHSPFVAEVIMTTQMTQAGVYEMMKAELSEKLGVDLSNVTIITNPEDLRAALRGLDENELRSFLEQQSTETFKRLDEEDGGWTDVPPVP